MILEPVQPARRPSRTVWLVIAGMAALGAAFGYLILRPPDAEQTPSEPILTEQARAYLPNLELGEDTGMTAREDALGQTLLEITGTVANNGPRVVSAVTVNVVFRDIDGLEIDRQRARIVGPRAGPLEPGLARPFRLAFDNVPPHWNQAFPSLYIAAIEFGE